MKRTLPASCKDLSKLLLPPPKRSKRARKPQQQPQPLASDYLESLLAEMHGVGDSGGSYENIDDDNARDVPLTLLYTPTNNGPSTSYPQVNYYTTMTTEAPTTPVPTVPTDSRLENLTTASALQQLPHQSQQTSAAARRICIEPRLLLRQAYKIGNEASAVIGLESSRDYKPAVYLVNSQADSVSLTFEDFLSIRCSSVYQSIEQYFVSNNNNICVGSDRIDHNIELFTPFYLDTILVEPVQNGGSEHAIALCNYHMKIGDRYSNRVLPKTFNETDIVRQDFVIYLNPAGWLAFKRIFDCIETYYSLCTECSPVVQHLISRYSRFLTKHYKTKALLSTSNCLLNTIPPSLEQELIYYVSKDLPLFIEDLNVSRVVSEKADYFYEITALRQAMTPWIDAEVRRFCVANIVESVLENLKYVARW